MKKVLIVNNNLDMGGIQKSLINLLREIHSKYDVTLLLFSKSGSLLDDIPNDVKVITLGKCYRILGLSKAELKKYPALFILKAFLVKYALLFSRRNAMKLLGFFQKKIKGYDVVISYSHLPNNKYFSNGCGDFVLDCTQCDKKICLVHCDYLNSGYMSEQNNAEYAEFDKIACCSDSVRERFIQGSKIDEKKVCTLRNFYDLRIGELAVENPYCYDDSFINIVTVARLSVEKGVDRAIDALYNIGRTDIRYYIIGDGPLKYELINKIKEYGMEEQVFLLGEQRNPYTYMINADFLLVPSLHEAAPIVFDEANILGLTVISTNTTSAMEMLEDVNGRICDNNIEGIESVMTALQKSTNKNNIVKVNLLQSKQFDDIINC